MKTIQNQPICKCRVCQQPMEVVWQQPLLEGRQGMFLVTCENEKCAMAQYTFTDRNYATMDLSAYLPVAASAQ